MRGATTIDDGMDGTDEGCEDRVVHTLPEYELCPTCVSCAARSCVPASSYGKGTDRDLMCAVCGWIFIGTPEQVAQAMEAERAWNTRRDDRKGPWLRVLRARAKRDKNQLRLFDAELTCSTSESGK